MKEQKRITSKENGLVKLVSALQSSAKARQENGVFVLEGLRLCRDALENGVRFEKLIVSDSAWNRFQAEIAQFAENAEECFQIADSLVSKISDTKSPQGICAVCRMASKSPGEINPLGRYIALERVADPANLGAVARTAEAMGVSGLLISSDGCDPYSPKALRASMGTLLRLPIFILDNFAENLSKSGLTLYACVVDQSAAAIGRVAFSDGSAVIIGNEAAGITEQLKQQADQMITIPMRGSAESLNAAAAAAIAIWEMMK